MTPEEFNGHARFLWGGRWHVALARKMGTTAEQIAFDANRELASVKPALVKALLESMIERRDGFSDRISQISQHTLTQAV